MVLRKRGNLLTRHGEAWDLSPEAQGDARQPELAKLKSDLGAALTSLGEMTAESGTAAARNSVAVTSIATEVKSVGAEIESAAHALQEMRAGADEAASAARESAKLTEEVAEATEAGLSVVNEALQWIHTMEAQVAETSEKVQLLADRLEQIGAVSSLIEDVAARTNMLSLNAAVEAARAGQEGATFAHVANEVRELAQSTAGQTHQIAKLIASTTADLHGVEKAVSVAAEEAARGVSSAQRAGESLESMRGLAERLAEPTAQVATAADQQLATVDRVRENVQRTAEVAAAVEEHAGSVAQQTQGLAARTESAYRELSRFYTGGTVDRAAEDAFEMAERVGAIFESALDARKITLEQVVNPTYEEVKGSLIARFKHLFDVSQVPPHGFDPPKYTTGWDTVVDVDLMRLGDEIVARNPRYVFALIFDLNGYAPSHNSVYSKAWTGNPERDLAGSRTKRSFLDNPVLARASRMTPDAQEGSREFLVQTYSRDMGTVNTVISVPIFAKGRRVAAACIAWES